MILHSIRIKDCPYSASVRDFLFFQLISTSADVRIICEINIVFQNLENADQFSKKSATGLNFQRNDTYRFSMANLEGEFLLCSR